MLQVHFRYVSGFYISLAAKLMVILHGLPLPQGHLHDRVRSFCQVADIVLMEPPLIVCLRWLLCWGGY